MFTWICPQCGREVPPSESECPDCAAKAKGGEAVPAVSEAPVESAPSAPAVTPAPPSATPAEKTGRRGLPGWLVTLLVAGGLFVVGAAGFYYGLPAWKTWRDTAGSPASAETPAEAFSSQSGKPRLAKFIEVTGFRITEDSRRRTQLQFLVVNHSAADIAGLEGSVWLRSASAKPGEAPLASFPLKIPSIGPYESREVTTQIETKLRAYELPDWQYLRADLEITAP